MNRHSADMRRGDAGRSGNGRFDVMAPQKRHITVYGMRLAGPGLAG